jgi:hypothetical protein
LKLIKPILDGHIKSVEVKDEVCEKYNSWLQNKLKGSVWTSCNSYYHLDGDKDTKIIATFPGSSLWLYWLMRKAQSWGDWKVVDETGWLEKQNFNWKRNLILSSIPVAAILYRYL